MNNVFGLDNVVASSSLGRRIWWRATTADPNRRSFWLKTIGQDWFPLVCPVPVAGTNEKLGEQLFFLVDVDRLTFVQRHHIVHAMAMEFGLTLREVQAEIDRGCMPLLAKDVLIECVVDPEGSST